MEATLPTASQATRRWSDLPTPPAWPLIGHAHRMQPSRLHHILEAWVADLGPMFRLDLAGRPALVCADHELLQQVLRERPQRFRRAGAIEAVFSEMGANGVFSVEGEAWKPQRKLVMQALAATNLRGFHPALVRITGRLRGRWARAAQAGRVLDMRDELSRYTVDVTTTLAFGEDPNTLDGRADVIQNDLALVFPMVMKRTSAAFPWWRWVRLPSDRRFDRAVARVHAHVRGLIQRAEARRREHPDQPPANALEALLAARDAEGGTMSDADVAANAITLLLGGEDTTAHTLAWTMYFLAADPGLQERMHASARQLLGEATVCPTHEGLRALDAFEALATEAMRLKPTVPNFFMQTVEDVVLNGVAVPRGTLLFFPTRPAMLDPALFGQPEAYRPERWQQETPGCPHHARAHVQFGAGPRVCPGRFLAGAEMRLVLSTLLRDFRIELACDPAEVQEVMAFTMLPDRMPVRLIPR